MDEIRDLFGASGAVDEHSSLRKYPFVDSAGHYWNSDVKPFLETPPPTEGVFFMYKQGDLVPVRHDGVVFIQNPEDIKPVNADTVVAVTKVDMPDQSTSMELVGQRWSLSEGRPTTREDYFYDNMGRTIASVIYKNSHVGKSDGEAIVVITYQYERTDNGYQTPAKLIQTRYEFAENEDAYLLARTNPHSLLKSDAPYYGDPDSTLARITPTSSRLRLRDIESLRPSDRANYELGR